MSVHERRTVFVPENARLLLSRLSKFDLLDIAWNLALLGTNETPEEILTKIAREAEIVCQARGSRLPKELRAFATNPLTEDPA